MFYKFDRKIINNEEGRKFIVNIVDFFVNESMAETEDCRNRQNERVKNKEKRLYKDYKFISGIKNLTTYEIQEIPDNAYYFSVATTSAKKLIVQVPTKYLFKETTLTSNEICQINTPKYIDSVIDNLEWNDLDQS